MNKNVLYLIITMIGLVFVGAGFVLLKNFSGMPSQPYPYILIGVGCGSFGHGFGELISRRALKNHPELVKMKEIELKDERNQLIGNKAKAKAYDCMIFVYGALMLALGLMKASMQVLLLMAFAYLFILGYGIYYRCKYEKEL